MSTIPEDRRSFRALLLGAACNAFGFFGAQVLVGFVVFQITGSSGWVGGALALYFAPMFFFGLASGAIVDWADDRRRLLRYTELAIATVLALAALYIHAYGVSLTVMLVFSAVAGSGLAMHQTLRGTIAYDLAGPRRIVPTLGRLNVGARIAQLAGAAAAGFAARELGVSAGFALLGGVHLLGAVLYCGLVPAPRRPGAKSKLADTVSEFITEVRTNRVLATLVVLTAAVEVLGFSFVTALPELARQRFDVGPEGLGTLHAGRAFGGLIAATVFAFALRIEARGSFYVSVVAAFAVAVMALSFAPSFWLAFAALAAIAALAVATDVLSQSMMQLAVPDRMRGRAMGAWVFAIGAAPLGHVELGVLVDAVGVSSALAVNGCLLAVVAVAALGTLGRLTPRASPR